MNSLLNPDILSQSYLEWSNLMKIISTCYIRKLNLIHCDIFPKFEVSIGISYYVVNFTYVCTWSISMIFSFVSITMTSSSLSFFFAPEKTMGWNKNSTREVIAQSRAKLEAIILS